MPALSPSSLPVMDARRLAELRQRAAARLAGSDNPRGSIDRAVDALAVLHALASSPSTAQDALILLHELQVHQVELDLQTEELRESRIELESALRRQIELYEFQPVGSLTVEENLVVRELNVTAARLLGVGRDEACGTRLGALLDAASFGRLKSTLARASKGRMRATCTLTVPGADGAGLAVLASVGADPAGGHFLISLTPFIDGPEPGPADAA